MLAIVAAKWGSDPKGAEEAARLACVAEEDDSEDPTTVSPGA